MQPAKLDLDLYRGDSTRLRVKLFAQDSSPLDLTGAEAKAEIRDRPAGDVIVPLICTIELPNTIQIDLIASDSLNLPQAGVWDLQLTFLSSGDVKTPLAGQVSVTPDVTDSTPVT